MQIHGAPLTAENLRHRLQHVYWIGGGPAGGKSTIARRIAERHGLALYVTDDVMPDHARRSTAVDAPYLERFKVMDMDERWLTRSPQTMLETFHWFRGEAFSLIVEDLLRLPTCTRVVAEGHRLLPHLVQPLLAQPRHAVWLLPTPEFRWAALESRDSTWSIPNKTSDPDRAQLNLIERDRMFTERLAGETTRLGLTGIELDHGASEGELLDRVGRVFGLDPAGADTVG